MAKKQEIKDPLNMDEAISASEAFFLKNKNIILGTNILFLNLVSCMLVKQSSKQRNCSVPITLSKL